MFLLIYLLLNLSLFRVVAQGISYYFSNIIILSCFIITLISNLYLKSSLLLCKSSEFGFINYFLNSSSLRTMSFMRIYIYKIFSLNSLSVIFFTFLMFGFFFFILLYNIINYMQLLLAKFLNLDTTVNKFNFFK